MIDEVHTEHGVWCRHCGEITSLTIQSRHAAEGIIRIRCCRHCRKGFRTIEIFYSEKYGTLRDDYPAIASRRRARA